MLCCSSCCEGRDCTVVCRCRGDGGLDSEDDGPNEWWPIGMAWRRPSSAKEFIKLSTSRFHSMDSDDDGSGKGGGDNGGGDNGRRRLRRDPNFESGGQPSRSTFGGAPENLSLFFNNDKIIFPEHYLPTSSDSRYTQRYALHLQQYGDINRGDVGSRGGDGRRGGEDCGDGGGCWWPVRENSGGWSMDSGDSPPARRRRPSPTTRRQSPRSECSDHSGTWAWFCPFRCF